MKNTKALVPVIMILIGLGVGFFGGVQYRNYQISKSRGNFTGANGTRFIGRNGQNGGMMGRNAVIGSILSMDANSITVKLADGSTKIVILGGTTTYSNTVSASQNDLKTGENVAVFGTPNSDGSVTGVNVQINPAFGRLQPSPTP